MKEPLNARGRRTRAVLLDAAWRLLEEEGGAALTMGEVARRAGVSRRAVYLHFATRTELVRDLAEHVDRVLDLEASLRPVREAPGAVEALEAFAMHLARYHRRILAIDRAVDRGRRSDPDLGALWDAGFATWLAGCRRLMDQLERAGRLAPPWTVATAADMLLALMRDEVVETLAVERGWSETEHARLLWVVFERTFVRAAERDP